MQQQQQRNDWLTRPITMTDCGNNQSIIPTWWGVIDSLLFHWHVRESNITLAGSHQFNAECGFEGRFIKTRERFPIMRSSIQFFLSSSIFTSHQSIQIGLWRWEYFHPWSFYTHSYRTHSFHLWDPPWRWTWGSNYQVQLVTQGWQPRIGV